MTEGISFRPHHFLCTLGFQGKGYSGAFTQNMAAIVNRLRAPDGGAVRIQVTYQADSICAPCPHKRGLSCKEAAKINTLDTRHADALSLRDGDSLTWAEAQARIVARVPQGSLEQLCGGCQWLELGLCETALSALHMRHKEKGRG
ncbi:DUF1284 domain-containing protein [Roseinatronobacter bogoriensis]|uniref:DUF1284 domain-containing protein n=1 Tax=Roseinatronobacter bogoriensis subsp. barguzinensis TaxID=441209 RepID=A0A2K8KEP8_9RHOB|nr:MULTISPECIES: DUF1284 domain-containing protein [Rhodobaca]ATX66413.1 DUF1284 domain-containing protein [Rhodobaca barguzinensis]MBB4207554.1 hypothetical protein [Rhodobaca bogoriensis DSM 18756]TDW40139.1 hypothetical protein LY39_01173 [Rhodobaca barguzinensis]TDY70709.1 hypothetical protein EV660_102384 [Rhodobaca bogoriensis DSM 18756]